MREKEKRVKKFRHTKRQGNHQIKIKIIQNCEFVFELLSRIENEINDDDDDFDDARMNRVEIETSSTAAKNIKKCIK